MSTILLIVLVLLLIGALPTWPYSSGWGYYPSGGVIIFIILILLPQRGGWGGGEPAGVAHPGKVLMTALRRDSLFQSRRRLARAATGMPMGIIARLAPINLG